MKISKSILTERSGAKIIRLMRTQAWNLYGSMILILFLCPLSGFTIAEFLGQKLAVLFETKFMLKNGSQIGYISAFLFGCGVMAFVQETIMQRILNDRKTGKGERDAMQLAGISVGLNVAGAISLLLSNGLDWSLIVFLLLFSFIGEFLLYKRTHALTDYDDDKAKQFIEAEMLEQHKLISASKKAETNNSGGITTNATNLENFENTMQDILKNQTKGVNIGKKNPPKYTYLEDLSEMKNFFQ